MAPPVKPIATVCASHTITIDFTRKAQHILLPEIPYTPVLAICIIQDSFEIISKEDGYDKGNP